MKFGQALKALQEAKKVCRSGWNGKGMWLFQFSKSQFLTIDCESHETPDIKAHGYGSHIDETESINHIGFENDGEFYPIADFILMKTADGKCVPWLASQTDVLANDWMIL